MDKAWLENVLAENKEKEFVQRILDPGSFPTMYVGDGQYSTHLMAWDEDNGKYYAYPTIIQQESGELVQLSDDDAWRVARATGNAIEFGTPAEADWFSKNYKQVWDEPEKNLGPYSNEP